MTGFTGAFQDATAALTGAESLVVEVPSGSLSLPRRVTVSQLLSASEGFGAGPVIAVLGDSISAQNTSSTATQKAYYGNGYANWLRCLSGQRFNFPLANNFGVGGDTLDTSVNGPGILSRVSDVIASGADICIVLGGTNDLTTGTSLASMKASMAKILARLLSAGIQPVVMPILPRKSLTDAQTRTQQAFNNWLRDICWGRSDLLSAASFPVRRYPILVDPTPVIQDFTDAIGQPLTTHILNTDGLHPTTLGGYWIGKTLNDALSVLYPPRPTRLVGVRDIYDATLHPAGSILFSSLTNYGLMAGTGGSLVASGSTMTGSMATGWTGTRSTGTSPAATVTYSKQNPRTDTQNGNGERQRMVVSLGAVGAVGDTYKVQMVVPGFGTTHAVGDTVFSEAAFELLAAPSNLIAVSLRFEENGPASPQQSWDMTRDGAHDANLPATTFAGVMRTPPFTIQSGTTSLGLYLQCVFDATPGTGTVDIAWSDVSARKLV